MSKIAALKQKKARLMDEGRALTGKPEAEQRAEDLTRSDEIIAEVERLDGEIRREAFFDEAERRAEGGEVLDGQAGMDLGRYNVARAVRGAMIGRLDGIEGEYHTEASRGRETRGVMVPVELLLERRVGQVAGTASLGGHTVATQLQALADRNRPALKVQSMGASVLSGLSGFVDLPNLVSSGTTSWVAENGNATKSTAAFNKVSMAPKTVTGEYQLSRRLILQSNEAIETLLRNDLGQLLAGALDKAAIKGGGSNEPVGILSTSGVDAVSAGGDFSDTVADMIAELELDDWTGTAGFLSHPKVAQAVRKMKDADDHVMPIDELFHGVRREFSTQVPDAIGDPAKAALIYGIWSELYLGYWSAVDILVNPYHADVASNGGVLLHAFLDADVAVRHPSAFKYALI